MHCCVAASAAVAGHDQGTFDVAAVCAQAHLEDLLEVVMHSLAKAVCVCVHGV